MSSFAGDGIVKRIPTYNGIPMLDIGTVKALREGSIKARPGIDRFSETGVMFTGGTSEPYEAVIFATGFETAVAGALAGEDLMRERDCRVRQVRLQPRARRLLVRGRRRPVAQAGAGGARSRGPEPAAGRLSPSSHATGPALPGQGGAGFHPVPRRPRRHPSRRPPRRRFTRSWKAGRNRRKGRAPGRRLGWPIDERPEPLL